MTLTTKQIQEIKELLSPAMHWLEENCHPHCCIEIDSERFTILEGLASDRRLDKTE